MHGKHHIVVESENLKYEFEIRRNITVIQGDSASGKTTLIELLQLHSRQGHRSGVRVESDVPCTVYTGDAQQWLNFLQVINNSIIFIDEDYSFVFTREFASLVKQSGNYYVIITRRPLKNLPYSIQEIYGIRTSGKYHFPEQVYHEFYPVFSDKNLRKIPEKAILLLEDQAAGYQFYRSICKKTECVSAEGNSNVFHKLLEIKDDQQIIVIADGAAFGAYINAVVRAAESRENIALYFPESFEWLILKSGILNNASIEEILQHPENYIESSEYLSWEQYFTELLEANTRDNPYMQYQKGRLPDYYTNPKNVQKILGVIPEELQQIIK